MGKLNLFQIGYKHKGENNMKVWLVDKTNLSPLNKQFSRNDFNPIPYGVRLPPIPYGGGQ